MEFSLLAALTASASSKDARYRAYQVFSRWSAHPTSLVAYHSQGRVLILADVTHPHLEQAIDTLSSKHECILVSPQAHGWPKLRCIQAQPMILTGFLGEFHLSLAGPDEQAVTLLGLLPEGSSIDLVLDLSPQPLIKAELPPPGYFAPRDTKAFNDALEAIQELKGDFEKPRYFDYDAQRCAHARSGIEACNRCLEACPADAIIIDGDGIKVIPYLCHGAGICATACPSGAIRYVYPDTCDQLDSLRSALKAYREAGGEQPVLLFYDALQDEGILDAKIKDFPGNIIPWGLEVMGCVGLDTWLAALAYGIAEVRLLQTETTAKSVVETLNAQIGYAHQLLAGLGLAPAIRLVTAEDCLNTTSSQAVDKPAQFAGMNDKRRIIRLALEHLAQQGSVTEPCIPLAAGAPFGEVIVDQETCTLCMACVSQCPPHALQAGTDKPELRFIEDHCIQCGLCQKSCPEKSISLAPRYIYDSEQRCQSRLLKQDAAFECVRCGKPFAPQSVIHKMVSRLEGHPMFQGEALQRIKMCEDCRVIDMMEKQEL